MKLNRREINGKIVHDFLKLKNNTIIIKGERYTMQGWSPYAWTEITEVNESHALGITSSGISTHVDIDDKYILYTAARKEDASRKKSRHGFFKSYIQLRMIGIKCERPHEIAECVEYLKGRGWIAMNQVDELTMQVCIDLRVKGLFFFREESECVDINLMSYEEFKTKIQ